MEASSPSGICFCKGRFRHHRGGVAQPYTLKDMAYVACLSLIHCWDKGSPKGLSHKKYLSDCKAFCYVRHTPGFCDDLVKPLYTYERDPKDFFGTRSILCVSLPYHYYLA